MQDGDDKMTFWVYKEELMDSNIAAEGISGVIAPEPDRMIEVISVQKVKEAIKRIVGGNSYLQEAREDLLKELGLE